MIKKLKLHNFRGIKNGEIELDNLTILLGSNNSGKTTILEALFLAPNPLRDVPYSPSTAVTVLHELHKTLESQGYAFLLYKYASDEAIIQWNEQDYLKMIATENEIYLETNKATRIFKKVIEYQGREIQHFGYLRMHENKWFAYSSSENVILGPNSLLISSELLKLEIGRAHV